MRIKHIYISDYKNLQDFNLDFDGDSFIDVFVGKNGSGKSNFFEALLEIFKHIFEKGYSISFNYTLNYEINKSSFQIKWVDTKWVNKDNLETKLPPLKNLPENILIYYSGHNVTVDSLVQKYEDSHKKNINTKRNSTTFSQEDTRRFIGIGSHYKSLLLSVMLLQQDNLKAKEFILNKLGIKKLGDEIKIVLTRPDYAKKKKDNYSFDEFDAKKRFWSAEGFIKTLLDEIWSVDRKNNTPTRKEGLIITDEKEEYILYRDLTSFQGKFKNKSALELFLSLDNLKTIGMLFDISVELELNSGKKININQFSDGQFQSIYIFAITELFKDKNCITLLDEPDSFLHPEWQFDFLKQVFEISSKSSESNHVLMTSHSAVTLLNHKKEKIRFFDFRDDNTIYTYSISKRIAINKLSSNLIRYSEQEQILSIINTIQIENKPVLFTEGKTDPLILKEAWNQLYPKDEIPFIPFYAFGHKYLVQLIKDPEVISDMGGLPIFGLFDYDKAFNSWNGFSDIDICDDICSGLIKKMEDKEVYAMMLPVPIGKPIESQVINPSTGDTFGERSLMAIEHLFCHISKLKHMFVVDINRPDNFIKFQGDKVDFAKKIVPTLDKIDFEVFKAMFEFIKSKIPKTKVEI